MARKTENAPKPDPRPVATADCDDCWAPAGGKHEWSCEQVPAGLFLTFIGEALVPDDVHVRVADVIERHLAAHTSSHPPRRLRDRAEAAAEELRGWGLLVGGEPSAGSGTVRERVAATLQARYNWPVAEAITTALADAGLLTNPTT